MKVACLLFASWRRASNIRHIGRRLGSTKARIAASFLSDTPIKDDAEDALLALVQSHPTLKQIVARHRVSPDALRYLYRTLAGSGAGQWQRGHWVAASALAYRAPLEFLLSKTQNGTESDDSVWAYVVSRIISYFKRGGGFGLPSGELTVRPRLRA